MSKGIRFVWRSWAKLAHSSGSGARPMYADMGKSCRPDPNRKIEYPCYCSVHS